MKAAKWVALVMAIFSGAACLFGRCVPRLPGGGCCKKAASIGIIGGADGPTAIFIASKSALPAFVLPAVFVASVFSWLFFLMETQNQDD